jgi:hypothetical protein
LPTTACRQGESVRFTRNCSVHDGTNILDTEIGRVKAGRKYEVMGKRGDWYQVQVYSNNRVGWTRCPVAE